MKNSFFSVVGCSLVALSLVLSAQAAPVRFAHKVSPKARLWLASPQLQRLMHRDAPLRQEAPVSVRFRAAPAPSLLAELQRHGVRFLGRPGTEQPLHLGRFYPAQASVAGLDALEACKLVQQVDLDVLLQQTTPLDYTVGEIDAPAAWAQQLGGLPLTGQGVVIGNLDTGVDPFHPDFFQPDGGLYAWLDTDGDGVFTPGTDAVDLNGNGQVDPGETLEFFDAVVKSFWLEGPLLGSKNDRYDPADDWLYADENGNGKRDFGSQAGFDDATPGLGEPLFVIEDLDGDGLLDPEEKLVRLGTSKIIATFYQGVERRRGVDLTQSYLDDYYSMHGTGTSAIMIAGQRGLHRRGGVAPEAEMLLANTLDQESPLTYAIIWLSQSGADLILHEYAPWTGYHLDGSSNHEQLMDEAAAMGLPQITPAGNLGGSDKHMQIFLPAQSSKQLPIEVPGPSHVGTHFFMQLTLLWRAPQVNLAFSLTDSTGRTHPLSDDNWGGASWDNDRVFYHSYRQDSERGTAMMDVYVYGGDQNNTVPIPQGDWSLTVENPSGQQVPLWGYVSDGISIWSRGIAFTQGVSEEGLICWPATADSGITVAAYAGHVGDPYDDLNFPAEDAGQLRAYSGRGPRIDGERIMDVAAPDNPVVALNRIAAFSELGSYTIFGGTSGAGPHVAGAAALIKQQHPELDGLAVRAALRQHALVDEQVGAVPSDLWGYGKLRVYRSLFGQEPAVNSPPQARLVLPAGPIYAGEAASFSAEVQDAEDPASALQVRWDAGYDGSFETTYAAPEPWVQTFAAPGSYRLKLEVKDTGGLTTGAAVLFEVLDPALRPDAGSPADGGGPDGQAAPDGGGHSGNDTAAKDEGCGCRAAAGEAGGSLTPLGLLLLLVVLRRCQLRRRQTS